MRLDLNKLKGDNLNRLREVGASVVSLYNAIGSPVVESMNSFRKSSLMFISFSVLASQVAGSFTAPYSSVPAFKDAVSYAKDEGPKSFFSGSYIAAEQLDNYADTTERVQGLDELLKSIEYDKGRIAFKIKILKDNIDYSNFTLVRHREGRAKDGIDNIGYDKAIGIQKRVTSELRDKLDKINIDMDSHDEVQRKYSDFFNTYKTSISELNSCSSFLNVESNNHLVAGISSNSEATKWLLAYYNAFESTNQGFSIVGTALEYIRKEDEKEISPGKQNKISEKDKFSNDAIQKELTDSLLFNDVMSDNEKLSSVQFAEPTTMKL